MTSEDEAIGRMTQPLSNFYDFTMPYSSACLICSNSSLQARRRAAADEEREELAHREGAQFGCSQTAVSAGDQQWANSLDVTIEAFSISAHDKTLFKDSPLQVNM